jgi:hypothetical protein
MRAKCEYPAHVIDVMSKLGLTCAEDRAVILKQGHSQKHPAVELEPATTRLRALRPAD